MSTLGFHLCIHLRDGSVIASDKHARRTTAQVVLAQGEAAGLYCFSLPDTHLHLGARCDSLAPGELCRRVGISLRRRLGLEVGFVMYSPIAVRDQRHLAHLVRYILTQHQHHEVRLDPYRESTNLPDLLGLRAIGGAYTVANLLRLLPRLSRETALGWLGAPGLRPTAAVPALGSEQADALVEAACRATALPALAGSRPLVVAARRALMEVVGARLPKDQVASRLGIAPRTARTLRQRPALPELVQAIRGQLALGAALATTAGPSAR